METPDQARYLTLPELSPYTDTDRFEQPKEVFKHLLGKLREITDPSRAYRYADIACANGEFLYFLKNEFPGWEFHGFDYEEAFLDIARSYPGLEGVHFEVADLLEMEVTETFDIVSFLGTMSTFQDPEPVLDKLLALCNEGGYICVDGYFNKSEVEVRAVYCDNSTPEGRGKWRVDWTQHTQTKLRAYLEGKCQTVDFDEVVMGVDVPRDPSKPHIDVWTFRDESGKVIITNGTNFMLNDVMMMIQR